MRDLVLRFLAAGCLLAPLGCGGGDDDDDGREGEAEAEAESEAEAEAESEAESESEAEAEGEAGLGLPCTDDSECPSEDCLNLFEDADLGVGYCTIPCEGPADCAADDGGTYDCLGLASGAACVRMCEGGTGCPEDNWCLLDAAGPGSGLHVCQPFGPDDLCRSNADCQEPETCQYTWDNDRYFQVCFAAREEDGTARVFLPAGSTCDPTVGVDRPCEADEDCAEGWTCEDPDDDGHDTCQAPDEERCTLFCDNGLCSGLCDADSDCPADMRCSRYDVNWFGQGTPDDWDDASGPFGICTYAAGSRTACDANGDCPPGESCYVATDATGAVAPVCVTRPAGSAEVGAACGDDPATQRVEIRDCGTELCIGRACSPPCATAADCPDETWECRPVGLDADDTARYCVRWTDCATDADCAAGEVCTLTADADGYAHDCEPAFGELQSGDACDPDTDGIFLDRADRCASYLCQATGLEDGDGRCSNLCEADADCAEGFLCSLVEGVLDNNGTPDRADDTVGEFRLCVFQPGSGAACTTTADCTDAGEVCQLFADAAGASGGRCSTAAEDGGEPGDECDGDDLCRDFCVETWFEPSDVGFCSALCAADEDCPAGFECRNYTGDLVNLAAAICLPAEDPRGTAR